jgi:hypothetical protein
MGRPDLDRATRIPLVMATMETGVKKPSPRSLHVRVEIEPGDPIGGYLEVEGVPEQVAFSGWIELMAAINHARTDAA